MMERSYLEHHVQDDTCIRDKDIREDNHHQTKQSKPKPLLKFNRLIISTTHLVGVVEISGKICK